MYADVSFRVGDDIGDDCGSVLGGEEMQSAKTSMRDEEAAGVVFDFANHFDVFEGVASDAAGLGDYGKD